MTDLLSLQRKFQRALTGVDRLDDIVRGGAGGLAIHKATIEAGLTQALANVFPAVRRVAGAPTFAMLAVEFINAQPPRHPVLANYGRGFPAFISMQPIGASLPYLQDLARVEWMRQESYLAADAPVLDAGGLDVNDAEAMSTLRLKVHPALRLITSPFPVHRIWRLNQPDVADKDIPAVDMKVSETVIVTRPQNEVVTRAIHLADATLVRAIGGGATLAAAVEAALVIAADFDVTRALAGHFASGTFSSPTSSSP
ncbi:MAG: putative DNA-binding domain-containing protein [Rhodospirillaceae bacterium]